MQPRPSALTDNPTLPAQRKEPSQRNFIFPYKMVYFEGRYLNTMSLNIKLSKDNKNYLYNSMVKYGLYNFC
jgi:hypothetical protein